MDAITVVPGTMSVVSLLKGAQQTLNSHLRGREWKQNGITRNSSLNLRFSVESNGIMVGRRVAFTTPSHYAPRLVKFLEREGAKVLWCPTIVTESTKETRDEVNRGIELVYNSNVSGVAFTSRAGMEAFSVGLAGRKLPGDPFIVGALGKDAEFLNELGMIDNNKLTLLTPVTAMPSALVEAMGEGKGRKILCPVPLVVDLEEPPVVPDFLKELTTRGWTPVRLNTYVTRWIGKDCARELLNHDIAAVIFTSTAEVEGLCKSMNSFQEISGDWRKRKNRTFLVATHGPVTARGADRLGVEVDVVGEKFDSFSGIVDQLAARLSMPSELVE